MLDPQPRSPVFGFYHNILGRPVRWDGTNLVPERPSPPNVYRLVLDIDAKREKNGPS